MANDYEGVERMTSIPNAPKQTLRGNGPDPKPRAGGVPHYGPSQHREPYRPAQAPPPPPRSSPWEAVDHVQALRDVLDAYFGINDYAFDACHLPLNCFDGSFRSFEQRVLPELTRRGIAPIGMKSLGGSGEAVKAGVITAKEALSYAMSLPVATTVSGIPSLAILRQNLAITGGFQPLSAKEMQALRARYTRYARDGRFELYKSSKKYDGAIGRQQHGFPTEAELAV